MKITTECVHCLLKRLIFEAELSTDNKELTTKVIKDVCHMLAELYDPQVCSAIIATQVHKLTYELLGDSDPYRDLKKQSNSIAQSLIPHVEELIRNSENPLKTSMLCSIIGNMMDFGIAGGSDHPERLREIFDETFQDGVGYDDFDLLASLLLKAKHVVLFTDNCGEIVFDKLLCRELKLFNPKLILTLVVRGEPILSDATIDDVKVLRFNEVVNAVLTTGCFAVGVDFTRLPSTVDKALREADLIVCKGMANFESFSETNYHPIAYLMRTKCAPIANAMNVPLQVNVIKVYP
jgi:uncharacterized protein with ATP-grasp and redox domains